MRKNSDAATDDERARLDVVGEYHLGEFINRFRHGSLVMRMPESDSAKIPTLIFGTVNGMIGKAQGSRQAVVMLKFTALAFGKNSLLSS